MSLETGTHTVETQPRENFDIVFALGKNWRLPIQGSTIHLSIESKMTALAAGEMYVNGRADKIAFLTAETAGINPETGEPYPPEALEMKRFLRRFFTEEQIPDSAIELDTVSFDTAGNAEIGKAILDRNHLKNPALLTVGYHLPRSERIFRNYGIPTKGFKSEEVLAALRDERYQNFFRRNFARKLIERRWVRNAEGKLERTKEGGKKENVRIRAKDFTKSAATSASILGKEQVARVLAATVDPKGSGITRKITNKSRHRA